LGSSLFFFVRPVFGYKADILQYLGEGHGSGGGYHEKLALDELSGEGITYETVASDGASGYGYASLFITDGKLRYPDGQPRYGVVLVGGGASWEYTTGTPESDCLYNNHLYCGPGLQRHDSSYTSLSGRTQLINYTNNGGNYVGICAGAYYASSRYRCNWDKTSDCGFLGIYLGIWPGITNAHGCTLGTTLRLDTSQPINEGFGSSIPWVGLYSGCDFADFGSPVPDTSYVAFFDAYQSGDCYWDNFQDKPAVMVYDNDGLKGRIVASGVHPEYGDSDSTRPYFKRLLKYALAKKPAINSLELIGGQEYQPEDPVGDGQYHYYYLDIPATEAYQLTVELKDGSGSRAGQDNDLYLRKGDYPTKGNHDYHSDSAGPQETINALPATSGRWYVGVYGAHDDWQGGGYRILANLVQITTTPTPTPVVCQPAGDIDCSGKVNNLDFGSLAVDWQTAGSVANLDGLGVVDAADAIILLGNYLRKSL